MREKIYRALEAVTLSAAVLIVLALVALEMGMFRRAFGAGIIDGQPVNAGASNAAWLAKNGDDTTIGRVTLANTSSSSGTAVTNAQREHNSIAYYVGKAINAVANALPSWTSTDAGSPTDNITQRSEALTGKFNSSSGHAHSGAAGDGKPIDGATLSGIVPVNKGGTGLNLTINNGVVIGTSSSSLSYANAGGADEVFRVPSAGGAPAFGALAIGSSSATTGQLPISRGGTGQSSATAAFQALSPLTTKGDLVVYSSSSASGPTRLPIGTNGQVLTVDSTNALGVVWSSASGGGGGGSGGYNMLKDSNPDFESSITGWTTSGGTSAYVSGGSNLLFGTGSATFDASSSSQYFESAAVTIPEGLKGANCLARMFYLGGDTNLKLQVLDGSSTLVQERTLDAAATSTQAFATAFVCPSSGSLKLRVASTANAAIIALDRMYLGENDTLFNISQSRVAAVFSFAPTTACLWSRTNTALGAFTADTDCPGPTVEYTGAGFSPQTTDADLPQVTMNNLEPGTYRVDVIAPVSLSTGSQTVALAVSDGTTTSNGFAESRTTTDDWIITASHVFTYTASANRTFYAYGSATANAVQIVNAPTNRRTFFVITKYPGATDMAYKPDQVAWYVDANISGATNLNLSTIDQASYITLVNSGLTLTQNPGSVAAQIACDSGVESSGVTCSGASEEIGVSFVNPTANNVVMACFQFSHDARSGGGGPISTTFQLIETPNNAETITQEGNSRVPSGTQKDNAFEVNSILACGTFRFATPGKKTIRLMYEQDVNTVTSSWIYTDANAAAGQRDVHFWAYPIIPAAQAPQLVNSVLSDSTGIERLGRISFGGAAANNNCTSSPCTIHSQSGAWISSVSRTGVGAYTLNIPSGFYSSAPDCLCNARRDGTSAVWGCRPDKNASTATAVPIVTTDFANVSADTAVTVLCMGPR